MASLADDQTRRQLLASMLASAAASSGADSVDPGDQPDPDALPVPKEGPYVPLVNRPKAGGYEPPMGPPGEWGTHRVPWSDNSPSSNMLASALAGGGAAPSAQTGPAASPAREPAPSAPPGTHYAKLPGPPLLLPGGEDNGPANSGGVQSNPSPEDPLAAIGKMLGIGGGQSAAPPQVSVAEAPGASRPIAGQTGDMAGGDPQQQFYLQHHAEALAGYNQAVAAARAAAVSSNPETTAAYLKAADGYRVEAEKAAELYGATLKPKGHVLSEEERNAQGLPSGVYQRSAEGAISPITGTQEDKETGEIQNYKFDQENRQKLGLPPISFSDWNTQKTMYGKGEHPLVDATGKEIDSNTTGDELLQALPPAVANHAKAIAEIREKWPSGTEQARQPQLQQALAAAQQLDPSLNQQTFATRQSMKNAAESGSGRINVANLANNTALFHSSTLADAIVNLNNSSNTVLNAAINSGSGMAGGVIPGAVNKADEVKQFNVARDAVANELERSFHGVGTTAEQAVARQIADLSVNDAPQTQLGALKEAQKLLKGKIEANEEAYKDTMGEKNIAAWERDHRRPFGFITPAAQAAGDRVAAMYQSVKAGKGFHGFEGPENVGTNAPQTAPAAQSVPTNAPQAAPRKGVFVPGKGIQWQ